jgi:isopentenyldiphosphate isomerase
MSEYIDVYDKDRRPTGRTVPRLTALGDGEYRLVVHICIFDSRGHMLIQFRSPKKQLYGGLWDVSAGGHSMAGETSARAASRELREELGIDCDFSRVDPAMSINFEHGFDDYYVVERDFEPGSLTLQASEVERVEWASLDRIHALIDSGEFLPFHKAFFTLLFDMHENGQDFFRT